MKELQTDKFDLLISSASEHCVCDEAEAFLAQETAHVEDNPRLRRKILGYRKSERTHFLKIACVAILICLSLLFTACMCVPSIRTAIWNVFAQLYDDHAKITFGDETEPPETESVEMIYPDHIIDCVELTYCPDGYIMKNETLTHILYRVDYMLNNDQFVFTEFFQHVINITPSGTHGICFVIEYVLIHRNVKCAYQCIKNIKAWRLPVILDGDKISGGNVNSFSQLFAC